MRTHKIATRVFKMIGIALCILLSAQLIFQTLFLEGFYISSKKTSISREIENLTSNLTILPEHEISKALRLFSQKFSSTTGVVSLAGIPLYGFDSQIAFMEVETEEGIVYKVYLSNYLENEGFEELLKIDQSIYLTALSRSGERDTLYPSRIKIGEKTFSPVAATTQAIQAVVVEKMSVSLEHIASITPNTPSVEARPSINLNEDVQQVGEMTLEGNIKEVYIPGEEVFGNGYRESKILEEMNLFIQKARSTGATLELGKPIIYESTDSYVGVRNIMAIVPMIMENEVRFLTSMTSLEQVEEAIGIMNNYTFIVFSVALIIALLLAYWYSKKLTKPLVEIKDITTAITNLDFSKTCKVQSEDEIGELAYNINRMSSKLKTTLEQLQEDMAFKERLSEQRKQFIVDVSHELKTPLTVLKATCEGFRDDIYEKHDKSYIYNMLTQIDAMSELIQELLQVVRLEQEEQLNREVFDLSDSILKIHAQLKSLAKDKQICVHMEIEESLVTGDRKKIETVIRNFYNNGIFYSKENEEIYITLKRSQDKWRCSIENTGTAIRQEELEKIWEPFYRVDQSRNKALGGSGLGLYIVKKILDSHKQSYGIKNTEKGVNAWFELEAYKETADLNP